MPEELMEPTAQRSKCLLTNCQTGSKPVKLLPTMMIVRRKGHNMMARVQPVPTDWRLRMQQSRVNQQWKRRSLPFGLGAGWTELVHTSLCMLELQCMQGGSDDACSVPVERLWSLTMTYEVQ
jgi:hypothetical protein